MKQTQLKTYPGLLASAGQNCLICAAYQISAFHVSQMMICRGISLKGCRKLELSSANEEGREMKMESKGEEDVLVTALEPPAYRVNFLPLYFK